MLQIVDVFEALTGIRPDIQNKVITDAVIDSRRAIPGALFIALPGANVDGHDYIEDAFKKGASFGLIQHEVASEYDVVELTGEVLWDSLPDFKAPVCLLVPDTLKALQTIAAYWRKKNNVRVIGITGSVGKSTTKELIAEILEQRFRTLRNPGNLNNEIGLPLTILGLREEHERLVLEMGFYVPGEIAFLCELAKPQVGVITNIGTVHAERAGSLDAIAAGKAELVEALPAEPDGVAILNYDDPLVRKMAEKTSAKVFYYGLSPKADLWADEVDGLGLDGIKFRLHYRNEVIFLRVPLIGRHSVHTVLRATAVGLVEGLTWQEIVNGLRSSHQQLRLVAVKTNSGAILLDDTYNASPQSMLAALNLLDELTGRKIAVLGDMLELGPYERQGHELVGKRTAHVVDLLISVGERAKIIAESARNAGLKDSQICQFNQPQDVIEYLTQTLTGNDVVLIKGSRGIRLDQIVFELESRK